MKLLLATRNRHKLTELARILDAVVPAGSITLVGLTDVPAYEEAPETGHTFAENALAKAREGVRHTGLPTAADDSGLTVKALNGMPGVFSARWAGRHGDDRANLDLVLAQIADLPDSERAAAFVCVAALVLPDGREFVVHGEMRGRLVRQPRGERGFGYDPVFVAGGETRTNAELTAEQKDAISHRGRAFRELAQVIERIAGGE
jgi:XTP/dITP diphosphohydrolase